MKSPADQQISTPVLGVLGSGSGSNYQALVDAIIAGQLDARIGCVISDKREAFILERARRAGHPAEHVDMAPFRTKLDGAAQARVIELLHGHGVTLVVLAGFMRMVKQGLLDAFPHRIINIHPSLLPAFPGREAWKQALEAGVPTTGCTVHYVDAGMDTGPVILQKSVPVMNSDTAETLHRRIQVAEHEAYPEAIRMIAAKMGSNRTGA